jgi:hypothetical protein
MKKGLCDRLLDMYEMPSLSNKVFLMKLSLRKWGPYVWEESRNKPLSVLDIIDLVSNIILDA